MKYTILFYSLLLSVSSLAQKRFITIEDSKIWVNTIGLEKRKPGEPLIVFESGHAVSMDNWDKVLTGVAKMAPLVTYDRPGIGKSEPDNEMPTMKNVADKLLKILKHLKQKPPYVLVGHSLGGMYVRGFAIYYPKKLAGLVIIDPADFTEKLVHHYDYYEGLGVSKAKVDSIQLSIKQKRLERSKKASKSSREELQVLMSVRASEFKEIRSNKLPNIPVHMLMSGRFNMPKRYRSKEYDNEAYFRNKIRHRMARWTNMIQSVDKGMLFYSGDAGHYIHWDDPELLISSVRIVLQDYALLQKKKKK
ncbi:hypothetical protein BKI52_11350 [marine bacterium AO1-C]|nr:hypothetical protein BKI52_11350 [marine bacterium AO1-C]